jgi:transcriptional regulator with XRE-family HTH domain
MRARKTARTFEPLVAERSGKDRAQIARWESDTVQPSFETLRELVRTCGFDLSLALVPLVTDDEQEARLRQNLLHSPQERLQGMLQARKS